MKVKLSECKKSKRDVEKRTGGNKTSAGPRDEMDNAETREVDVVRTSNRQLRKLS